MNRKIGLVIVVVAMLAATGAVIMAQGSTQLRNCATCAPPSGPAALPSIGGEMRTESVGEALSTLSFDDGTCEGGLGIGAPHTAFVEFDVPSTCQGSGLDIVGITARVNTFTATAFAFGQAGATPPVPGAISTAAMPAIAGLGPCPATGFSTNAIGPAAAVITGTSNFFAGFRYGSAGGFVGRDTNSAAMRQWLNCPTCGMTQYSPADITGIGFPGNFLIRVTVEDQNCIPVELIDFDLE